MADSALPRSCVRICLTPTRNESWIIQPFLAAARHWADRTIVADQGSIDGTLQVLQSAPAVDALINNSSSYDEAHRQRLLIGRARELGGKRILIALDADEALSANCIHSDEWEKIAQAEPGTVLRFRWVNILPGFREAWIPKNRIACGYVDDGAEHSGVKIHSTRIPTPQNAPVLDLQDIVVLHFQYIAWDRVVSKHRWYQAWEHLNHPEKGPLQIFRNYHHMYGSWSKDEIQPVRSEWLSGYEEKGINYRSLTGEPVTWWDREIIKLLREHGPKHFRRIALWNQNWNAVAAQLGQSGTNLDDPRSMAEKLAHRLLTATQPHRANWLVRALERLLRKTGW